MHVTRDRPSITFSYFATMLEHSPLMHQIVSCLTPLTDADALKNHMKSILMVVLELCKHKDSCVRWNVVDGNMERFKSIVLSDEFAEICCNREGLFAVQHVKCPINESHQKYCLRFNRDALLSVYAEFDEVCITKIQGHQREQDHNKACVEDYFAAVVSHLELFSECVLRVCHVYDMCFVRKKAFTGCFAFTADEMRKPLMHWEPGNLVKFTLYSEIGGNKNNEDDGSSSSEETSLPRKRIPPHDRTSPPLKSMKLDTHESLFLKIKNESRDCRLQWESTMNTDTLSLKKLNISKVHRSSTWWEKFMLNMFFTQKAIYASNDALFPSNNDWELSHEDYIDISKHRSQNHLPEYHRMSVYTMPPWYLCIIKNIEGMSQSSTRKPFRDDSIDILRKMCQWEDITSVFFILHITEQDQQPASWPGAVRVKAEIGKIFNMKYKTEYPCALEPQTKAIMKILSQYSVLYHPPINTGPLWPSQSNVDESF